MLLPARTIENECLSQGYTTVVGIDEAGRGPLVGSVVAAAVVRKDAKQEIPEEEARLLRDSKKLSPKQREKAFLIAGKYFWIGIGECDNAAIDRMNILEATMLAMRKAVSNLHRKIGNELKDARRKTQGQNTQYAIPDTILLVDGNKEMTTSLAQRCVVNGDAQEQLIATASIVAKVTRDREMEVLHKEFPLYGFDRHKGYSTKAHLDALKKYGPTPFHRFSFRPVLESVTMKRVNRELSS